MRLRRRNASRKAARKRTPSLTEKYKRLRRLGAKLAHKAQWHGFQPICIANSPSAVRCSQRTSDCYEVNRVSVAPRGADVVGSLKVCRGGTAVGRDALNNTSGECVVAKANEADCLANAEVQTREEGGCFILEFTSSNFCRGRTTT